jgi:hypothetical protein
MNSNWKKSAMHLEFDEKAVKTNLSVFSENDTVQTNDDDLVDMEIGRHGYYPSSVQEREELRKSYRISRDGADAKLSFHVTDSKGKNVADSFFHAGFIVTDKKITVKEGTTDENGVFVAEGKAAYEVNYVVEKDGYYMTSGTYKLSQARGADVRGGKWQPWNRTVRVTLKEKRDPIPMYVKEAKIFLPQKGELFGYDFEKGDLVTPYGKGEQADLLLMCTFEERGIPFSLDYKAELFITAVQQGEGVIVNTKDTESRFPSRHEAQKDGYEAQYHLITDRTSSKILQNVELSKTEYLTFCARIVRDEKSNIISSNYGKIDGGLEYGRNVKNPEGSAVFFTYYFNPTPNDRNLEFNGNNLFER